MFVFRKVVLSMIVLLICSCIDDSNKEEMKEALVSKVTTKRKSNENLNVSFLLDLSDRINPKKYPNETMEFYQRDIAYIKSVSEAFNIHLRNKRVRNMNEKIQVFFDPSPKNQNINSISEGLKYDVSRDNASLELLDEIKNIYATKPKEIYELAITDNKYVGSDTWRFFKNKVKDYCIEDGYRNILVILTDGYIYHKNTKFEDGNRTTYLTPQTIRNLKLNNKDWENKIVEKEYGFIPATSDLSNLEILVLGINPDIKNPYEEDIIKNYWSEWFDEMKVKRYELKTAYLPSNMDKIIKEFILN